MLSGVLARKQPPGVLGECLLEMLDGHQTVKGWVGGGGSLVAARAGDEHIITQHKDQALLPRLLVSNGDAAM